MSRYLIIGNGVAGTTAAEHIRKTDREGSLTILTDEAFPFYWRVRLNEFVSGDLTQQELVAKKESWYAKNAIDLHLNCRVVTADAERREVATPDGRVFGYERLLIATGSHSFIPPIKGSDAPGVFALRSLEDARAIMAWAAKARRVVLIGGGLLGLEAGNALRKLGKAVCVVEFFPRLLPRQLDVDGAQRLQAIMEDMGFTFRLGAKTQEITAAQEVQAVRLEGGEELPADMVIISAGVRPNMQLAAALGLEHDKGIKVDESLRTSRSDVFAAGDVAEFKGMVYGIWPASMEQGRIAGVNMAGGDERYAGTTMANTLKVVGVDLASAGNIDVDNQLESRVVSDTKVYKKIVFEDNRIAGCIMLGDTKGFPAITRAMTEKQDVSRTKDQLLK